jgi:hypothetical protein
MNIDNNHDVTFFSYMYVFRREGMRNNRRFKEQLIGSGVARCLCMTIFRRQDVLENLKRRLACINPGESISGVNILTWNKISEEEYTNFNEYSLSVADKDLKNNKDSIILHFSSTVL